MVWSVRCNNLLVGAAYLISSRAVVISGWLFRSSLRRGRDAREKPVPLTSQPARENALTTCRPRRPVAPVMRTVFAILEIEGMEGDSLLDLIQRYGNATNFMLNYLIVYAPMFILTMISGSLLQKRLVLVVLIFPYTIKLHHFVFVQIRSIFRGNQSSPSSVLRISSSKGLTRNPSQ